MTNSNSEEVISRSCMYYLDNLHKKEKKYKNNINNKGKLK